MAKILLIDDSESLLFMTEQVLISDGHEVVAKSSGADALALLDGGARFDLVLTDMYMPPPDGFEIMQAIRQRKIRVPFIVMSTNPLACDVFRAARVMGAVATLQKPFSAEKLLTAVSAALSRPRAA
jgi:CheY-like chemotaxis protein